MQRKEILFNKNQPSHILTRAVDKKGIFQQEEDCLRFIFQMYAANVGKPAPNLHRKDVINTARLLLNGDDVPPKFIMQEHPCLVHCLSFALVGNHYHFNLVSNAENGISIYMQRLNIGFAKYHNLKYGRKGTLFESRYKIVLIQNDFQLDAILRYINIVNPLDVFQPGWRENGLRSEKEALEFLNQYQFSSFPDLFGKRKSKFLAPQEVLEKFLGEGISMNQEYYIDFIRNFLEEKINSFTPFYLE